MGTFKQDPAFTPAEASRVEEIRQNLRAIQKEFQRFANNLKELGDSHRWDTEEFLGIALETERRLKNLRIELGRLGEGLEVVTALLRGRALDLMLELEGDATGEGAFLVREVLDRAIKAVPSILDVEHHDKEKEPE